MLPTMLPATTLPRLTALSLPQRRLAADAFRRGVRGCDGGAKFAVQARRRTMPARRLVLALAKAQREVSGAGLELRRALTGTAAGSVTGSASATIGFAEGGASSS